MSVPHYPVPFVDGPSSYPSLNKNMSSRSGRASGSATIQHPLGSDPLRSNNVQAVPTSSFGSTPRRRGRRGSNQGGSSNQCTMAIARSTSTQQQQGTACSQQVVGSVDMKGQLTKQLPRSVRWRLSLGLLTTPSDCNESKEKLLKSVEEVNALKLRFQRSRYDDLEKKHYWKNTPTGIADGDSVSDGKGGMDNSSHTLDSLHHVAPGDDPLSALLGEKGRKADKGKWGNGIFGNRARTRSKDNLLTSSFNTANSSSDGEDEACKGSRWGDFYSTREVLGVIEKDLDRLPQDHYTVFHEWRLKNRGWMEHREKEEEWKRKQREREEGGLDSSDKLDGSNHSLEQDNAAGPQVQSMRLNTSTSTGSMRHAANQKQSLSQSTTQGAIKQSWTQSFMMKKRSKSVENLAALLEGDDDDEEAEQRRQEEKAKADQEASIKERAIRLSQILFVYAREHPEIGYRQGMHEILSYILLALEMDMLDQAIKMERKRWRRNSLSYGIGRQEIAEEPEGSRAGVDSSGNMVVVHLLDPSRLLHDAFSIFEYIMTSLAPAYDAIPADDEIAASMLEDAKSERGESPMEMMTSSIVSKIRFVARDEQLYGHVLYMPVPPQLYFAKWIRLMFGREVTGGMKGVMALWDAFFDLAASASSDEVPVTTALLDVLKAAACAMILLIRHRLLAPSMGPDGMMTGDPDPNIGIAYLMNYPPMEDIGPLIETITDLLSKEKKLVKGYQVTKERRLDGQYLPSENYKVASNVDHPLSTPARNGDVYDNGQRDGYSETRDQLPQVYRTNSSSQLKALSESSPALLQSHDVAHDVAESLGHIAGGLLDFGSKTANAAISTIQKQYDAHKQSGMGHPLQNDAAPSKSDEKYAIQYRTYAPKSSLRSSQSSIEEGEEANEAPPGRTSLRIPIGGKLPFTGDEDEESADEDIVNQLIAEAEKAAEDSGSSEDLNESVSSKLSESNRVGESVQKSPKELANMLEKSVATLMRHFETRLSSEAPQGDPMSDSQHSYVPPEIWDAMAEIDLVRKELVSQAALSDLGRSSNSLRSSGNMGNRRGRPSWHL